MNNDITRNVQNCMNAKMANPINPLARKDAKQNINTSVPNGNMQDSMTFLGSLGCAQVKMNNTLRHSIEEYMANKDFVESHVAFCDSLVEEGMELEKAIITTDFVFDALRSEDTYI